MIGKTIRQRLIVLTLTVLVLALLGSLMIALGAFNTTLRENTYAQLSDNADYLKTILLGQDTIIGERQQTGVVNQLKTPLDTFSKNTEYRVTLIGPTGLVIYDSDYPLETLDNHLWRQEVQKALTDGMGISERRSDTQGLPVLYHAVRIDEVPEVAILRVSTTLNQLLGYQQTYLNLFYSGLAVLVLLVGSITAISIAMITRPLHTIKNTALSYAKGDLDATVLIESPKELADLAKTMRTMAIQLKQTLTEVHEGRSQLETLLESMTEGIVLIDRNMVIRIANTAARALLFNTEKAIEGVVLNHTIRSTEIVEAISQVLQNGEQRDITIAHYGHLFGETARLAGRSATKTLKISLVPVYQEKTIGAVVMTINDMTELHHLEQVRKDFVANVSHELKTPITAIAGFSNLLLDGIQNDEDEHAHFIQIINRQALNMQRIVEDLLLLSSLEQQNAKPTCTWTTAEQIMTETVETCRYKAEQKRTEIVTQIENPKNLEIWANGMLIVQALANLVMNAITYSNDGSTVRLNMEVQDQAVTIRVTDSGVGIPKESQQRIFERFYRVDAARSRSQGGTGLGLSIVKHIVGVHGGTVAVNSELGKGSTFTIILPRSSVELEMLQSRSDALYQRDTP